MDYNYYMSLALEQARKAFDKGEFPVGCVIVETGEIIATSARRGTSSDKSVFSETDHAEIIALKEIEEKDRRFDSGNLTLFSTMEPCLMCFGAILLAGIDTIVYGYEDPMGGGTACDLKKLPPLYAKAEIDIIPGILRQKSLDLFYNFFNKDTNLYWKNSYLERYTLEQKKRIAVQNN